MIPLERKLDWLSSFRGNLTDLVNQFNDLKSDFSEYTALGLDVELVDADFQGEHAGLTKAQIVDALGVLQAWDTALQGAAGQKLYKVKYSRRRA